MQSFFVTAVSLKLKYASAAFVAVLLAMAAVTALLVWQHDTTHLRRLLGARDVEHGEAVRLQDGLQPPMRELGIS